MGAPSPALAGGFAHRYRSGCITPGLHHRAMASSASAFKAEIARVARKKVRCEIESLKKANIQHRSAIALLRPARHVSVEHRGDLRDLIELLRRFKPN
ncbi:hypothetical protein J7E70_26655 [Variovorax paradoxus]|nr:hypothetical protein [Variovorax paradoxus]